MSTITSTELSQLLWLSRRLYHQPDLDHEVNLHTSGAKQLAAQLKTYAQTHPAPEQEPPTEIRWLHRLAGM